MPTGEQYNLLFSILAKDETQAGVSSATAGLQKVKAGAGEAATATESMGSRMRNAFSSTANTVATLKTAFSAITTAAAALSVGLAAVSAAGSATNNTLDQTAITLGVTSGALKDMVQSSTSATASITGFTRTIDYLSRTGDYSLGTLQDMTEKFGTLAKSIKSSFNDGITGDVMAKDLTPMFEIWDKDIDKIGDYSNRFTDAFTQHRLTPGTVDMDVQKVGQAYEDAGFSMEEFLAIEESLSDAGVTGRTRVKDLKEAIASADAQMQAYTDSVKKNADAHTKLAGDLQTAQDKYASLGEQIGSAEKQIAGYNAAISETQQNIADLTQKYNEAVNDTSDYASAYKTLTSAAEGYQNSITSEQQTLENLNAAMAENQKAYEKLTTEYAAAEQNVADLSAQYQKSLTNVDFFAAAQASCKDKVSQLSDKFQTAKDSVTSYTDKIADLADKHIDLEKSLTDAQETMGEANKAYRDALSSTEILDDATKKHADTVEGLQSDYEKLGDSIEKYQDDLLKNEHDTGNTQKDLAKEQETLSALTAEYNNLTSAKNSSGGSLYVDPESMSALSDKMDASKQKIDDYTWKIQEAGKEHSRLAETLDETVTAQSKSGDALSTAQSDNTWYTDALTKTKEAQDKAGEAALNAAQKVQDLGKQLSQNEKDTTTAEVALSKAQGTVSTLAGDLETAQKNLSEFGSATIVGTAALTPYQKAAQDTANAQAALAEKLNSAKENAANLKEQMGKNREDLTKDQTEYGKATLAISGYVKQLADANTELQKFHSAGLDKFTEPSAFDTATAAHDAKVTTAQDALDGANKTLKKQQGDLDDANTNLSKLQKEKDDAANQVIKLQAQIVRNQQDGLILASQQPDKKSLVVGALGGETGGDVNQSAIDANVGASTTGDDVTKKKAEITTGNMPITEKIGNLWDKFATWAAPYANSPVGQMVTLGATLGGITKGIPWVGSKIGGLLGKGAASAGGIAEGLGSGAADLAVGAGKAVGTGIEDIGLGLGDASAYASRFGAGAAADIATGTSYAEWGLGMAPGEAGNAAGLGERAVGAFAPAATEVGGSGILGTLGTVAGYASKLNPLLAVMTGLQMVGVGNPAANPTIENGQLTPSDWYLQEHPDQAKSLTVDTKVNTPTGDFDWAHFLSGGLIETASAGDIQPIDYKGEIKPTVTGGETVTETTKGEIKKGTDAAPKSGPFDWLTNIFGKADDGQTVPGSTTQTITDGLAGTPKDNADDPFSWLTSIFGTADDGETIQTSGQDTIDTGTGAIPTDNLLNPLGWLSSILGTADDANSIQTSGTDTITAGTGAIPRDNLLNPMGWLSSILGTADDKDSIYTTGYNKTTEGVGKIPKAQTFDNKSTINGKVTNPDWWTGVRDLLSPKVDLLKNWFIGALNTALNIPSTVSTWVQNQINNVTGQGQTNPPAPAGPKPTLPLPATFGQPGTAWVHVPDSSVYGYHWENKSAIGGSITTATAAPGATPVSYGGTGNTSVGEVGSGSVWTGGYHPQYADGGIVPGSESDPVQALVHGGEVILNSEQQSRVGSLLSDSGSSVNSGAINALTAAVAQLIETIKSQSNSAGITIQTMNVTDQQDIVKIARQLDDLNRQRAYAAGYRSV